MVCKQTEGDIQQNWIILAMLLIWAITPAGLLAFQVSDGTDNGIDKASPVVPLTVTMF